MPTQKQRNGSGQVGQRINGEQIVKPMLCHIEFEYSFAQVDYPHNGVEAVSHLGLAGSVSHYHVHHTGEEAHKSVDVFESLSVGGVV